MGKVELEKMEFMVSHAKADINLCAVVYRMLCGVDSEEQAELLARFIKGYQETATDGSVDVPIVISDEQERYLTRKYQRMVDGHLEELINTRPILSKQEFYEKLTDYIMNNQSLRDNGAREFAIYDCCIDKRLPYAPIDLESGLRMENDEYKECIEAIGDEAMERVKYIMNANLEQKTERASLLLREFDSIKDKKMQTVLFATILTIHENNVLRAAARAALARKLDSSLSDLLGDEKDDSDDEEISSDILQGLRERRDPSILGFMHMRERAEEERKEEQKQDFPRKSGDVLSMFARKHDQDTDETENKIGGGN